MRNKIISLFFVIIVLSLVACGTQKQASGTSATSSENAPASNDISGELGDAGTADQDLNVNDTGSDTDAGLNDVQTI